MATVFNVITVVVMLLCTFALVASMNVNVHEQSSEACLVSAVVVDANNNVGVNVCSTKYTSVQTEVLEFEITVSFFDRC
jgi:hypothetical protein